MLAQITLVSSMRVFSLIDAWKSFVSFQDRCSQTGVSNLLAFRISRDFLFRLSWVVDGKMDWGEGGWWERAALGSVAIARPLVFCGYLQDKGTTECLQTEYTTVFRNIIHQSLYRQNIPECLQIEHNSALTYVVLRIFRQKRPKFKDRTSSQT